MDRRSRNSVDVDEFLVDTSESNRSIGDNFLSVRSGCAEDDDDTVAMSGSVRFEEDGFKDFRRRRCIDDDSSQEEEADEKDDEEALVDVDNAWDNDSTNWDGEEDESCSSAEAKEAAIRQGLWDWIVHRYKNDLFQQFLATIAACYEFVVKVLKKCIRGGEEEPAGDAVDAAKEVMEIVDISASNQMGSSSMGHSSTGGGAGASGTTAASVASGVGATQVSVTVVGQMATQAATSAAGASAASTAAAASVSAAAVATAASAVASVGVVSQVGITVGIVVVTAAAVSGGVAIKSAVNNDSNTTAAPVVVDKDPFVPQNCSTSSKLKRGFVELKVQGMPEDALPKHQDKLELLFRDLYNNITGMCLDPYSRVLHRADLIDWSTEDSVVFLDGADNGRHLQLQATFDISQFFPLFAASFGFTIEPVLFEESSDTEASHSRAPMQVVFATTKVSPDRSNGDSTEAIISSIGQDTIQPFIDRVEESEGIIILPFISDELSSLAKCLSDADIDEEFEESALCKELQQMIAKDDTDNSAIDREALAACLQAPSNPGCQEVLGTALETVADITNLEGTDRPPANVDGSSESGNEEPEAGPNEMADIGMSPAAGPSFLLDEGGSIFDTNSNGRPEAMVPAMPAAPSQPNSVASDADQQSIPTVLTPSGPSQSAMNINQLPPSPGLAQSQGSISIVRPTMLPSTSVPINLPPTAFTNEALPPLQAPTPESITQPNAAPSPRNAPVSSNGAPMQSEAKPTPAQSIVTPTAALSPTKLASTTLSSDTKIGLLAFPNNGGSRPTAQAVQGPVATPTVVTSLSPVTSMGLNRFANDHGFLSEQAPGAPTVSIPAALGSPPMSIPAVLSVGVPKRGVSIVLVPTTQNPTTLQPTGTPTALPTKVPTMEPTDAPTDLPTTTEEPTFRPTFEPTVEPTVEPTMDPTLEPTFEPTVEPTGFPTILQTRAPTLEPTIQPTQEPAAVPSMHPSISPSIACGDVFVDVENNYYVVFSGNMDALSDEVLVDTNKFSQWCAQWPPIYITIPRSFKFAISTSLIKSVYPSFHSSIRDSFKRPFPKSVSKFFNEYIICTISTAFNPSVLASVQYSFNQAFCCPICPSQLVTLTNSFFKSNNVSLTESNKNPN
ncbi:ECF subfamily RNA polymerase sigma-24 subunit [Seminavis robusta]|uniref:ECF subfamily RNA polymerase sigma-24 subunit n=1 Tax=Seminavis robusta TaxID=568900 RepID=A0A9N8H7M9_9STRA|nr:ECF subfamily RNA polymerase sigma-24 subunit [Seminavis robusta]|eukprot:Sro144_g067110.1 ECF subfamily RNA polymerase sigma-24 subunit (1127) ;mRNA; r:86382-90537